MPKKKEEKLREWIVPVQWTSRGFAFVVAASAEEAKALARSGSFTPEWAGSEMTDWQVDGEPEENI